MKPDLRARALKLLSMREYSRLELRQRLLSHAEEEAVVDSLLDDLEARHWLSEERFVEQIVHARQGKYGSLRLAHELREKGVSAERISAALDAFRQDELEAARAVWQRKFGKLPEDAKERAKQMRFLQSRGFGAEVIRNVLKTWDE
jgi:regulatory protein